MANFSVNPNIPTSAKSQIPLPSNEDFILFFDTENLLHLTGAKNIGGVLTFFDYEIPITGGLNYKGVIDASTNPNFPAAVVGDIYVVSVSGTICDIPVSAGDMLLSKAVQGAGCVVNNWDIVQGENTQLIEGTHAEILTLATNEDLIAGNLYRITNPFGSPNGLAASLFQFDYTILLQANSQSTFDQSATMECDFINDGNRYEVYSIIYNFGINDLAAIISVSDIRGNIISSSGFASFQFGNNDVNGNIVNGGSLNLQDGIS